jgi:hypothetical protein
MVLICCLLQPAARGSCWLRYLRERTRTGLPWWWVITHLPFCFSNTLVATILQQRSAAQRSRSGWPAAHRGLAGSRC